jgi:Spy/CpxP family protein refolding chaperone
MRISTLIVAGIAALSALSGAVIYQHGGMDDHFAMIAKHLNLTPSQEKQFKAEHEAANKKAAGIDANTKLDKAAKMKAKAQIHQDMMAKAHKILTPDQLKQLAQMHSGEMQKQMMKMMEKLDLNQDQKAAIHQLMSGTSEKMSALHNDKTLSDAQKQAKAEQLHNDTMAKIHGLLTPEQLEKAKAMHGSDHSRKGNIPPK